MDGSGSVDGKEQQCFLVWATRRLGEGKRQTASSDEHDHQISPWVYSFGGDEQKCSSQPSMQCW